MLNIFNSIILGIVEGVTEFLPVSSTGHLILVSHLLKLDNTNFLKSFEIIIQLGAISSVFIFYYKHFFNIENLKKIFIAFLPTAIIGFTLYKILKEYLLGNTLVVISSLFFGGIIMILIEKRYIKNNENKLKSSNSISENILEEDLLSLKNVSYKKSFYLGLWQSLAIIPGISRSGSTIIGGLLMNLRRETIVHFSFLLALPTILSASLYDLLKNYKTFSIENFQVLATGFITSFIFSMIFTVWLLTYIKKHNFIIFGYYRIIIAILFFIVFYI